jgi:hypothetical protein
MNGHLRRCRFGIPPHVRPSTLRREAAFVRHARGDSSLRLASDAFLNRLQHSTTRLAREGRERW